MASIIYAEIAWYRFKVKTFPCIPICLQDKPPHPHGASLPCPPSDMKNILGDEWKTRLNTWWKYFLALVQYWAGASSDHVYGRPARDDSKVMYYVFYCMERLFKIWNIPIKLYAVKALTPWGKFGQHMFVTEAMTKLRAGNEVHREELDCHLLYLTQQPVTN